MHTGAHLLSGLTPAHLADLLRKEQYNSYGILAPLVPPGSSAAQPQQPALGGDEGDEEGERELRGGALYALASLINHECNPNVARFEYFDRTSPTSTHIIFKAMHDLPPGETAVCVTDDMHAECQILQVQAVISNCLSPGSLNTCTA
jgi:SET and MYND domain-containing protein